MVMLQLVKTLFSLLGGICTGMAMSLKQREKIKPRIKLSHNSNKVQYRLFNLFSMKHGDIFPPSEKSLFNPFKSSVLYPNSTLYQKNYSLVYSTEILWNSSGEIGMGPQKEGLARIKFAV